MNQRLQVPISALTLTNKQKHSVSTTESKVSILAYSGQVIQNHWYWNNLAIDLKGIGLHRTRYPILENHDRSRKVGFFDRGEAKINGNLRIEGGRLLDTDSSEEFQRLSKQGFPYQSSIYAVPSDIERLGEGESALVNGYAFKGPGTIWRKCALEEVSVCVIGWDKKTRAEALSENALSLDVDVSGVPMDDEDEQWVAHMLSLVQRLPEPHQFTEHEVDICNRKVVDDYGR